MCGSASTSTRSPRSIAVADVTGPIDTTSGCGSGSASTASQKFVTVDDDVNVERVDVARAHARDIFGIGSDRHRAVDGQHFDVVSLFGETFGKHVARGFCPCDQHPHRRRPGTASRSDSATKRSGTRSGRMPWRSSARAVPGPIAATRTVPERTRVEPARCKTAIEERVDPVGGREDHPRVVARIGKLELDRLQRDRRQLDHLRTERFEPGAQLAGLLAGTGDNDAPAEERCVFEPTEVEGGHCSDDDRTRRLRYRRRRPSRASRGSCADSDAYPTAPPRPASLRRGRPRSTPSRSHSTRPAPMSTTSVPPLPRAPPSRCRSEPFAGSSWPVTMVTLRRQPAMRHRDSRVRGRSDRTRDAGHDLERDSGRRGMPRASSPPRPNTNGSPPLRRTTS